jgi:hypothetical protein
MFLLQAVLDVRTGGDNCMHSGREISALMIFKKLSEKGVRRNRFGPIGAGLQPKGSMGCGWVMRDVKRLKNLVERDWGRSSLGETFGYTWASKVLNRRGR